MLYRTLILALWVAIFGAWGAACLSLIDIFFR
jgi:hypothetical protein